MSKLDAVRAPSNSHLEHSKTEAYRITSTYSTRQASGNGRAQGGVEKQLHTPMDGWEHDAEESKGAWAGELAAENDSLRFV